MAERAHPDLDGFRDRWRLKWRFRLLPWPTREPNPYRLEVLWRYQWVAPHCVNKDVVDIPCGMGWGTSLIKQTRSLRGFDISSEAIAEARRRYGSHAQFTQGSMERLELPDESADTIVCLEGIEHVPQEVAKSFVNDARRVLRHDGQLLLSSPHCSSGEHSGNPYHVYEYQPQEMRALLETCFVVDDVISRQVDNMVIHYFRARPKG